MVRLDFLQVIIPLFVYFAEPEVRPVQVSNSSVPATSPSLLYGDDKDLPVFEVGKKERYTIKEAVKILLMEHEQKCSKTPLQVRRNLSFLVDVSKLGCWQDVKSDMNGVYHNNLRVATWTVEIDANNHVEILEKKKVELGSDNDFHVHIHSTKNKAGLCRSIFHLLDRDEKIVNSTCLLQYSLTDRDRDEVNFDVPSHRNSKSGKKPFYPTQKSTMEAIKRELASCSASVALKNVSDASGGVLGAREPGELPRSRKQLYDLKNKMKQVDQVDELLQYAKQLEKPIVLEHHDVPEDLWVLSKPHMTADLSRFCTSEVLSHPFSVDPTFNFGKFEVTPFTYKHLFLKSKRTGTAPVFLGPTAIHYSKQKAVYSKIVHAVASNTPNLADKGKGYITDGEDALYSALREVMRQATGLRCFRHFYQNCRDKLHKLGIQKKEDQKFFLEVIFGKGEVSDGILDARDKSDLKNRLSEAKELLEREEMKLTGRSAPEFWNYIIAHKKMMRKCMIATAREKAGMPLDASGKPLKSYTNQSESINNKLTRQKEAIAKNDKSKVDLTKLQFTRDVWEEVDRHQQEELQLAICGLSEEYELAELAAHLAVSTEEWFNMNRNQRSDYVLRFNKMSVEEALKGKTIPISNLPDAEQPECQEFSEDVTGMLQSLNSWTDDLVKTIVKEAEALLNCKDAVQNMPSLTVTSRKKYLVGAQNCKKGMYECTVHSDHISCTCPCYKYNNLCKHSLCVAEKAGILKEHLNFLQKSSKRKAPSKSALVEPSKEAQGKKGGSHKNPWRPSRAKSTQVTSQSASERPFTEIHHNNNSFILRFLDDVPQANECRQCRVEFPRRKKIIPFDVILSHEEKWYYPDKHHPGRTLPSTKHTTKYYCVKGSCIKKRFPYYDSSLLEIPPEARSRLQQSHFDLLRREIDYDE